MSTEDIIKITKQGLKNIAILVDEDLKYYKDLKDFLESYNHKLYHGSFIKESLEENKLEHHYPHLQYDDHSWSGTYNSSQHLLHLYKDNELLHMLFGGKPIVGKLTLDDIKELKKTIWIKLNSEQEIKNAYDLLIKYNQNMYKDKNGIPLLIGAEFRSEGYLGINSKNNPEFGVWSNNIHNTNHIEEIKVKHNFIIDNLELLEYLFKQEEELLNK